MDPEIAQIPKQSVLGICLDCEPKHGGATRETTENGRCAVCGSDSVIRKGAIKELAKQLRIRDERTREFEKDKKRRARKREKERKQ